MADQDHRVGAIPQRPDGDLGRGQHGLPLHKELPL